MPRAKTARATLRHCMQRAIESLEPRLHLASTLIPVANYNDLVFDDTRNQLYISTEDGKVQRWDVASGTLLGAWTLGTKEHGIDISPDGKWLYVAEGTTTGTTGTIHKVDLNTGSVTELTYQGSAPWELVALSDNKVYFSTLYPGSGWSPIRVYDAVTGNFSSLGEFCASSSHASALTRNATGNRMFIAEVNNSGGPMHLYDATTGTFLMHGESDWYNNGATGVSRMGEHYANDAGTLTIYRHGGSEAPKLLNYDGGMLFSPTMEAAYLVDLATKRIDVVQMGSWAILGSIPFDETPYSYYEFQRGEMAASSDGKYLYVGTQTGVRQYDMSTVSIPLSVEGGTYTAQEGGGVRLSAYGVNRPDRPIVKYEWDLDYSGAFTPDVSGLDAWTTWYSAVGKDGPSTRTAAVRVTDSLGNVAIDTVSIGIENSAPTLTLTGPDSATAGAAYNISFAASDPGVDTVSSWRVDWGDGTSEDLLAGTATGASHVYADGTFRRTVKVTATDEDGSYSTTKSVLVQGPNDAPTIANGDVTLSSTNFNEGTTITLSGVFADIDTADTHTVTIKWGDGTADSVISLGEGVTTFSKTHLYSDDNPSGSSEDDNTIEVIVSDGALSASASKIVHIKNVAPVITMADGPFAMTEGYNFIYGYATDPEPEQYYWTVKDSTGAIVVESTSSVFSFTLTEQGTYNFDLKVSDDDGGVATKSVVLNVANRPVGIMLTGATTTQAGSEYSLSISTSDPGDDTITSSYIDWGDGTVENFTGVPANRSHIYTDGTHRRTITVGVTDEDGSYTNTKQVLVQGINDAPVVTPQGLTLSASTIYEGEAVTISGVFTDQDTADAHEVQINWGDGTSDTVFSLGEGVTSFSGKSHNYADDNPTGTPEDIYPITVTVKDTAGLEGQAAAAITVRNRAPTVNGGPDQTAVEGKVVSTFLTMSDSLADTRTITWVVTDSLGTNVGSGTGAIAWTAVDNGVFTLTITVTDDDGGVGTDQVNITVGKVSPTLTVTGDATAMAGTPYLLSLSATDPGADTISKWTINWGDGVTDTVPGGASPASHVYADGRHYRTIQVSATDEDGTYSAASRSVYVDGINDAPVINDATLSVTPVTAINEGGYGYVTFSFSDADTADAHTVTIDWGDGASNTYSLAAGVLTLSSKSHRYLDNPAGAPSGAWPVTVTVSDGTLSDSGTGQITVQNLAPVVSAGSDRSVAEGTTVQFTTASVVDADPVDVLWTITHSGGAELARGTSLAVVPQFRFPDEGVYFFALSATDDEGAMTSRTAKVTVANAAPTITLTGAATAEAGVPYDLTISISDPGADTITSMSIDWGDGTIENLALDATGASHTYADGTFNRAITVRVTDEDGTFTSGALNLKVIGPNDAPVFDESTLPVSIIIDEQGWPTISGSFQDDDLADTHVLTIDWGDGRNPYPNTLTAGKRTFSFSSMWSDDSPSGTPEDTYTVKLTISDGELSDTWSFPLTVRNVAPRVTITEPTIKENQSATINITTADGADTVSLLWRLYDPAGLQLATGTTTSYTYLYPDSGEYYIDVTAADDDGGQTNRRGYIHVRDVDPVLSMTKPSSISEGVAATFAFSGTDVGRDTISSWLINWGDGTTQTISGSSVSTQHTFPDGPKTYWITGMAIDEDGTHPLYPSSVTTGTLDTAFGSSGAAIRNLGGRYDEAVDMVMQKDGKILVLVCGTDYNQLGLIRYNTNGTVDTSYGGGLRWLPHSNDLRPGLVLDANERAIVAFDSYDSVTQTLGLDIVRYTTSGDLDTTFGTGGIVRFASLNVSVADLQLMSDGRMVLAGLIRADQERGVIMRMNPDGSLDESFGDDGVVETTPVRYAPYSWVGGYDSLALQPDGKVVVVGTDPSSGTVKSWFHRYTADGQLDVTFGEGGSAMLPFGAPANVPFASVIYLPDGDLLAAGQTNGSSVLFRVNSDGTPDPMFGGSGMVIRDLGSGADWINSVTLDNSGRYVIAGQVGSTTQRAVVARFMANGDLDSKFATSGIYTSNLSGYLKQTAYVAIVSPRNDVIVGGTAGDPNYSMDSMLLKLAVNEGTSVNPVNVNPSSVYQSQSGIYEGTPALFQFQVVYDSFADTQAGFQYSFDFDGDGSWDVLDASTASVSHAYSDDGLYQAKARVRDKDGGEQVFVTDVLVRNAPPAISLATSAYVQAGYPAIVPGAFTDPGADNWTATVDYGDGSGVQPLILNANKQFVLNHAYSAAGVYPVIVTVDDGDGGISTAKLDMVTLNAPQIASWGSALTHGTVGQVALSIPDTGLFRESRGGGIRRLLVDFDQDLLQASVTSAAVTLSGNSAVGPLDLSAISATTTLAGTRTVQIDFSSPLPDIAVYLVTLSGVQNLAGMFFTGDADRVLAALKGDANGDGQVSASDLSFIKAELTSRIDPADISQVRSDIANDGRVTATDISQAKANVGHRTRTITAPGGEILTGVARFESNFSMALIRRRSDLLSSSRDILG